MDDVDELPSVPERKIVRLEALQALNAWIKEYDKQGMVVVGFGPILEGEKK